MQNLLTFDQKFFEALTNGDTKTLGDLLADDFLLVSIADGAMVSKVDLIGAITSGAVQFGEIQSYPEEAFVRHVGDIGIVVGRTKMTFTGVTAASRYTHVFVRVRSGWRLLSAQGTEIKD
ncbi:nuclear transport factor 2 family protein [Fodinicola feengrottensis]|uniref:DUF4440 domain-containing protein n=1 Tax=Fodinicola feengrottensis TaxID=435914 RepID=A0ABN2IKN1_9ACTN|nr:nuclear transport factor 2 family protein [Fodinicola feengrottensis]